MRTISHAELKSKKSAEAAGPELHELYRSLLGVAAFLLLTRIDIAVFVSALQRWCHAPLIIHVKRLNALTRWVKENPRCLHYYEFGTDARGGQMAKPSMHLRIFSDSAFKKEESSGHCMRGSVYLLCEGQGPKHTRRQQHHICWTLFQSNSVE